ncbi:CotO family spore coat protein [Peribacillus tepidiphilus]|uniref:CotO family spore coat protein n=1 Tax=Peribacillus tepidiphilus TaxID=2652445 RepID=UPI001290C4D7|nr:CotO family spore coat protein [Peribacillus tepidiphilus]
MSREKDEKKKTPFMYIIQPSISPPQQNMQSEYRSKRKSKEVVEIDDESNAQRKPHASNGMEVTNISQTEHAYEESFSEMEVVEVSTSIEQNAEKELDMENSVARELILDEETIEKNNKKKKFSEMSKEELMNFLARIPLVVPKPICEMVINGTAIQGSIEKKKGDLYLIKTGFGQKQVECKLEDIESIKVLSL